MKNHIIVEKTYNSGSPGFNTRLLSVAIVGPFNLEEASDYHRLAAKDRPSEVITEIIELSETIALKKLGELRSRVKS